MNFIKIGDSVVDKDKIVSIVRYDSTLRVFLGDSRHYDTTIQGDKQASAAIDELLKQLNPEPQERLKNSRSSSRV